MGAVLLAAGVVVGGFVGAVRQPKADPIASVPASHETSRSIDVHVGGWVMAPGVVKVAEGSIVADAIAAAGGALPGAVMDQINLAASVQNGDQVLVPGPGTEAGPAEADGIISLNRATAADLQDLPGVGPVLAERIVQFREDNGLFETIEDLLEVSGIGESKLAALRDLVRVP